MTRRWLTNLGLLVAVTLVAAIVSSVYISTEFAEDQVTLLLPYHLLLWTALLLPGALVYLWVLEVFPREPSRLAHRAAALALTPLVGIGAWVFLAVFDGFLLEWASGALAVLLYGGVVRLRPPAGSRAGRVTTSL